MGLCAENATTHSGSYVCVWVDLRLGDCDRCLLRPSVFLVSSYSLFSCHHRLPHAFDSLSYTSRLKLRPVSQLQYFEHQQRLALVSATTLPQYVNMATLYVLTALLMRGSTSFLSTLCLRSTSGFLGFFFHYQVQARSERGRLELATNQGK